MKTKVSESEAKVKHMQVELSNEMRMTESLIKSK